MISRPALDCLTKVGSVFLAAARFQLPWLAERLLLRLSGMAFGMLAEIVVIGIEAAVTIDTHSLSTCHAGSPRRSCLRFPSEPEAPIRPITFSIALTA